MIRGMFPIRSTACLQCCIDVNSATALQSLYNLPLEPAATTVHINKIVIDMIDLYVKKLIMN